MYRSGLPRCRDTGLPGSRFQDPQHFCDRLGALMRAVVCVRCALPRSRRYQRAVRAGTPTKPAAVLSLGFPSPLLVTLNRFVDLGGESLIVHCY